VSYPAIGLSPSHSRPAIGSESPPPDRLGQQVTSLGKVDSIREDLISLVLEGASAEELMSRAAAILGCALVICDARGGLLLIEPGPVDGPRAIAAWEDEVGDRAGDHESVTEPIEIRGAHRADLVALKVGRAFDAFERTAVRQVALTLGLEWLGRSRLEVSLRRQSRGDLLRRLLEGRIAPADAEEQLVALGDARPSRVWPLAAVLRGIDRVGEVLDELGDGLSMEMVGNFGRPLVDVRDNRLFWAAPGPAAEFGFTAESLVRVLRRCADRLGVTPARLSIAVGAPVEDLSALRDGFETALLVAEAGEADGGWRDARRPDLSAVAFAFKDDPKLIRFAQSYLGRLDHLPERRRANLLETLRAILANGGQKSEAARRLHLDRGALYKRLNRLDEVLEIDLDDPTTRCELTLALALHDAGATWR
jgi:purine catabolism regulator